MGSKGTQRAGKNRGKKLQKFRNSVKNFSSQLGKNRKNSQLPQERENTKIWDFFPFFFSLKNLLFHREEQIQKIWEAPKKFGNKLKWGKGCEKFPQNKFWGFFLGKNRRISGFWGSAVSGIWESWFFFFFYWEKQLEKGKKNSPKIADFGVCKFGV